MKMRKHRKQGTEETLFPGLSKPPGSLTNTLCCNRGPSARPALAVDRRVRELAEHTRWWQHRAREGERGGRRSYGRSSQQGPQDSVPGIEGGRAGFWERPHLDERLRGTSKTRGRREPRRPLGRCPGCVKTEGLRAGVTGAGDRGHRPQAPPWGARSAVQKPCRVGVGWGPGDSGSGSSYVKFGSSKGRGEMWAPEGPCSVSRPRGHLTFRIGQNDLCVLHFCQNWVDDGALKIIQYLT